MLEEAVGGILLGAVPVVAVERGVKDGQHLLAAVPELGQLHGGQLGAEVGRAKVGAPAVPGVVVVVVESPAPVEVTGGGRGGVLL